MQILPKFRESFRSWSDLCKLFRTFSNFSKQLGTAPNGKNRSRDWEGHSREWEGHSRAWETGILQTSGSISRMALAGAPARRLMGKQPAVEKKVKPSILKKKAKGEEKPTEDDKKLKQAKKVEEKAKLEAKKKAAKKEKKEKKKNKESKKEGKEKKSKKEKHEKGEQKEKPGHARSTSRFRRKPSAASLRSQSLLRPSGSGSSRPWQ